MIGIPGTRPGVSLDPELGPGGGAALPQGVPASSRSGPTSTRRAASSSSRGGSSAGTIPPLVWLTGDDPVTAREAEYFQYLLSSRLGVALKIDKQTFKQRLAKMTSGRLRHRLGGLGARLRRRDDLRRPLRELEREQPRPLAQRPVRRPHPQGAGERPTRGRGWTRWRRRSGSCSTTSAILPKSEAGSVYVAARALTGVVRHVGGARPGLHPRPASSCRGDAACSPTP